MNFRDTIKYIYLCKNIKGIPYNLLKVFIPYNKI